MGRQFVGNNCFDSNQIGQSTPPWDDEEICQIWYQTQNRLVSYYKEYT